MSKTTRGRLSAADEDFIKAHLDTMTDEEIAKAINKTPEVIARRRLQVPAVFEAYGDTKTRNDWRIQLKTKFFYPELEKQLTRPELDKFIRTWVALCNQFSDEGIKPTDEMMIKDLILQEIMLDRNGIERRRILDEMDMLKSLVEDELKKSPEVRNVDRIANLREQQNALFAVVEGLSKDANLLQQRKDTKFRDLKSTRDQRFRQLEEAKKDIFGLIQELATKKMRMKEGRQNCLCQMCAEKEKQRLGQVYQYEDGSYDKPLLSADTVVDSEDVAEIHADSGEQEASDSGAKAIP